MMNFPTYSDKDIDTIRGILLRSGMELPEYPTQLTEEMREVLIPFYIEDINAKEVGKLNDFVLLLNGLIQMMILINMTGMHLAIPEMMTKVYELSQKQNVVDLNHPELVEIYNKHLHPSKKN